MSYKSWIEAVKSVGLWVESVASDKARQKGLIHVGKGRYKEKEDGAVVAKSSPDGETLLKVSLLNRLLAHTMCNQTMICGVI